MVKIFKGAISKIVKERNRDCQLLTLLYEVLKPHFTGKQANKQIYSQLTIYKVNMAVMGISQQNWKKYHLGH